MSVTKVQVIPHEEGRGQQKAEKREVDRRGRIRPCDLHVQTPPLAAICFYIKLKVSVNKY